jgi:hypothetical protein
MITLGKSKWERFKNITVLVLMLIALAIWAISYIDGFGLNKLGEESKGHIAKYIAASAEKNIDCSWAGFGKLHKTGVTQVYVLCSPKEKIPVEINSEEELHSAISEYVVSPGISRLPMDEKLSVVSIMQLDENTVTCTNIIKQKIVGQWIDSYENYCLP